LDTPQLGGPRLLRRMRPWSKALAFTQDLRKALAAGTARVSHSSNDTESALPCSKTGRKRRGRSGAVAPRRALPRAGRSRCAPSAGPQPSLCMARLQGEREDLVAPPTWCAGEQAPIDSQYGLRLRPPGIGCSTRSNSAAACYSTRWHASAPGADSANDATAVAAGWRHRRDRASENALVGSAHPTSAI